MKPPRELDALVAEKVMGWQRLPSWPNVGEMTEIWQRPDPTHGWLGVPGLPHYSTSIEAAWEVVERVIQLLQDGTIPRTIDQGYSYRYGFQVRLQAFDSYEKKKRYYMAGFSCSSGAHEDDRFLDDSEAEADTAPHAICLAALKAVGE